MCISKILSYFAGETKKENVNLVIDIGNTVAKLAVFDGDKVVEVLRGSNHSLDWLSMLCNKYPIERGIIASVITLSNTIRRQLAGVPFEIIELNHLTPIPIRNLYKTPETLGGPTGSRSGCQLPFTREKPAGGRRWNRADL